MHISVTFFGHGEILSDSGSTLLSKVGNLAFSKLLLGTTGHQLTDKVVLVVKTLLVSEEDGLSFTIATDTEFSMLHVVRPIEFDVHVVLARLEVLILLPGITVHAGLTILVGESLLFSVGILDLSDNQSDVGVVVVNMAVETTIICLVDSQIVMATGCGNLEANESVRVKLMAGLEEGILVVVVNAAKLNSAEVLNKILLAHEEGTIISIRPASDTLRFVCPLVRVITPVSFPFEVTPRVSKLEESDGLSKSILDHDTADQTVRMVTNKTKLFKGFDGGAGGTSRGCHDPVSLIGLLNAIPKRFIACFDNFSGGTSQITKHILGKTGLDALVT